MSIAALKFWNDRFLWCSSSHLGGWTSRPSPAVLIGAWGELNVGHESWGCTGRAVLVGPMVRRSIDAMEGFYSLNLDPVHALSIALREEYFGKRGIWDLTSALSQKCLMEVSEHVRQPANCEESYSLTQKVLFDLFGHLKDCPGHDPRILRAATWLRENLPNKAYMAELCELCDLSQGRLTHLFTEQMGVPIKSYLLAMKMRRAAEWFGQNRSLTEIAHMMGFSDSPHLSRAFQSYFSVPPSLLTNTDLVSVCVCDGS